MHRTEPVTDGSADRIRMYGPGKIQKGSHQITVPAPARADFGIEHGIPVVWFGDLDRKWLILVREPPAGEYLKAATRWSVEVQQPGSAADASPEPQS